MVLLVSQDRSIISSVSATGQCNNAYPPATYHRYGKPMVFTRSISIEVVDFHGFPILNHQTDPDVV